MGKKRGKKKILIGTGIAVLAIAGIVGGLYIGKKIRDRHRNSLSSRGLDETADCLYYQPNPTTFTNTISIPDAVVIGLAYENNNNENLNLIAACFDKDGNNLGYIQGNNSLTSLFDNAIKHDTSITSDNENIIINLDRLPSQASQILFGTYLAQDSSSELRADIHMIPVVRGEEIEEPSTTRDINEEEEDDDDDVFLYKDQLETSQFRVTRGFVSGKIFKDPINETWKFTPYRLAIDSNGSDGLWPAFDHYAKYV